MYRLLIVDDERHVADALETIFLSHTDIELEVYKAYLATDALEIFARLKIDILLSDIKMPGIDGFGLADRVKAHWSDAKIIFLTAYNDFELLYRTKKYEDVSFLLKTEDEETMLRTVAKAIADIEEKRRIRRLEHSMGDMRSLVLQRIKNDVLLKLLKDAASLDGVDLEREYGIRVRKDRRTVVLCFSENESGAPQSMEREKQFQRLATLLSALLGDRAVCELVLPEERLFLALIQGKEDDSDERVLRYVHQMFDVISESILSELNGATSLLLSDRLLEWEAISETVEYMKTYLSEDVVLSQQGGGRIFSESDEQYIRQENDLLQWKARFLENVKIIHREMEAANFEAALHALAPIRQAAEKVKSKHHYPLIIINQMIANALLDYVFSRDLIARLSFSGGICRLCSIDEYDTWSEAFDYLETIIGHVSRISLDLEKDSIQRFMTYIQEYVQHHLSEELSLTILSERMNYNPSYISRLFKQLSGRNLLEYINTTRMEYAANQLLTTTKSIQEIAKEAGITSAQYFATSFRKRYGQSPQEYRRTRKE